MQTRMLALLILCASTVSLPIGARALTVQRDFSTNDLQDVTICHAVVEGIEERSPGAVGLRLSVTDVWYGRDVSKSAVIDVTWKPAMTAGEATWNLATNVSVVTCLVRVGKQYEVLGQYEPVELFPDGCPVWVVKDSTPTNRLRAAIDILCETNELRRVERLEECLVGKDEELIGYSGRLLVDVLRKHGDAVLQDRVVLRLRAVRDNKGASEFLRRRADSLLSRLLFEAYRNSAEHADFLKTIEIRTVSPEDQQRIRELLEKAKKVEERAKAR